jgi:hypothetical protein
MLSLYMSDLNLTKEQFLKLPRAERDACMYENISELNNKFETYKKAVSGYKFWNKLYSIVGGAVLAGVIWLFVDRLAR